MGDSEMKNRAAAFVSIAAWAVFAPATARAQSGPGIVVYPESPTGVEMSNRDINRIVCSGGVFEDYKYSGEKGILVEAAGSDAFVKFQIMETGADRKYVTARSEFFFKCNGRMFTLFATPKDVPSRTIHLGGPQTEARRDNLERFNPLSDEERAVAITHDVLRESTPASFSKILLDEPYAPGIIPGADIRRRAHIYIEGSGFSAAEFLVRASRPINLTEITFASRRFGTSIYAITIESPQLKAGEVGRVVLIYRGGAK